ncbi:MAG: peroxide stress protein YaaA [Planctomycetaceae bacterium]|jgi:uncharacterized protein|nr:peroxide stress protein YaaA [Planctomycetaceae bacterium]MBT6484635.1 peroxide stress protein YaaA [Planctomycetaceae bacterium]MBT6498108.1 peroxide stress protein YaaA [Planctomycetaceae bacterium]
MLIVLAPAKTLDFQKQRLTKRRSTPALLKDSEILIGGLRRFSPIQLSELMGIGHELADATHRQFAAWTPPFTPANAKQAILTFRGNAYVGLNADAFSADDFDNAQQSLRILSGLYGVLRPLDLIQPYRLEMATKLKTPRGKNLYEFWGTTITEALMKELKRQKTPVLMNLSSNEYFKSIKANQLDARIVTPDFKEARGGTHKSISAFSKKARGLMASHIIRNRLTDVEDAKSFDAEGYRFNAKLSSGNDWIFTRKSA